MIDDRDSECVKPVSEAFVEVEEGNLFDRTDRVRFSMTPATLLCGRPKRRIGNRLQPAPSSSKQPLRRVVV